MKVIGGIKGITNKPKAMDQYFLIATEMGNIIDEFFLQFNIEASSPKRDKHYQLRWYHTKNSISQIFTLWK